MIADLKPYPAMKDTAVPWLGQVPALRFVGGDVSAWMDRAVTPGTGLFVSHLLGLVLAVALAGYLYRRKIFLRI